MTLVFGIWGTSNGRKALNLRTPKKNIENSSDFAAISMASSGENPTIGWSKTYCIVLYVEIVTEMVVISDNLNY